jgi:hypothetical protein
LATAAIVITYMVIANPLMMAFVMLTAANFVSTIVYTSKETIKFTLFSTVLLFLLFSVPLGSLAVAAICASIVGSYNPNRAKYFVNAMTLIISSLGAIYIYGVHEITIAGIIAAGLLFEILNNITLIAGISYFGKETLKELYMSWRGSWAFGLLAPVSALIMIYFSSFAFGLACLAIMFTLLSKPQYFTGRFWLHGRWFHASAVRGKASFTNDSIARA